MSNALPKTSYVKMIDLWLLFNLTIPLQRFVYIFGSNTIKDGGITATYSDFTVYSAYKVACVAIYISMWLENKKDIAHNGILKLFAVRVCR